VYLLSLKEISDSFPVRSNNIFHLVKSLFIFDVDEMLEIAQGNSIEMINDTKHPNGDFFVFRSTVLDPHTHGLSSTFRNHFKISSAVPSNLGV
jgi:hypothetical protein